MPNFNKRNCYLTYISGLLRGIILFFINLGRLIKVLAMFSLFALIIAPILALCMIIYVLITEIIKKL